MLWLPYIFPVSDKLTRLDLVKYLFERGAIEKQNQLYNITGLQLLSYRIGQELINERYPQILFSIKRFN